MKHEYKVLKSDLITRYSSESESESDLREAFKIFDRDNDGYISIHEFKRVGVELWSMVDISDGIWVVWRGGQDYFLP